MSSINLRLYGEQLYPNISKYLSKYINPEIQKEDFITMYKNGLVELKQLSLKEKIQFNPQITMENASIEEIKLNIPNEQENFSIYLNNMKSLISFSHIKEDQIELLSKENKKALIEEFIKYAVSKIEKKDGPSFFDNLIKSVIDKVLNGLTIEINNLELEVKLDNKNNNSFIFLIEKINYSDQKGIKINNICLTYKEDSNKMNIIDKFDFNIDIIHSNEEGKQNQINLFLSDFKFELKSNVYSQFLYFFDLFDNAKYKKVYLQYKKLILFHKPIRKENKIDYKALWYYAIKTIIKLQKYIKYNKPEMFDLIESSQIKIIKKYLENEKNDENFLLPDKKNTLKATKEKVEKKVLENKKGNVLANAFSFFFSAKKEEDKKDELTEEEKEISDEIYKDSNIINYINGNINNNKNTFSSITDKVKKFISNVSIDINISKLEIILQNANSNDKPNLFITGMKMNINYLNDEFDFKYIINDIGYANNKSIFDKDEKDNAIEFSRDKNNFINLKFGFKNIELPLSENLIIFYMKFFELNKSKNKQKLFHEKKYNMIIEKKEENEKEKEKENELLKGVKNFSFINNFKLSNIPSFSIKTENNKITINTSNYFVKENSFSFTVNIKDSYGEILKELIINPKKENNQFIFHCDSPIKFFLSNQSTKSFVTIYLKYMKAITNYMNKDENSNDNNKINIDKNLIENNEDIDNDNYLFGFNYTLTKNIDLGNIDMNDYILDIIIKAINVEINEGNNNYKSYINLNDFKLLYKQKKLDIELNEFQIKGNIKSTIILYCLGKPPKIDQNIQKNKKETGKKDNNLKKVENVEKKNINNKNNLEIKNNYNFMKLLNEVLLNFNFRLKKFVFAFNSKDLIIRLDVHNMNLPDIKKGNESLKIEFDNYCFYMKSPLTNNNAKKIFESIEKTTIEYVYDSKKLKGYLKSPNINLNLKETFEIWDHVSFLFEDNDGHFYDEMNIKIKNLTITSNKFIYNAARILITNVNENIIMDDIFYFTIYEFNVSNKNKHKLFYEKKFDIVFDLTKDDEYIVAANFNKVDAFFSQLDVSYILLYYNIIDIDVEENAQENNRYSLNNINKIKQKSVIKLKINIPIFNLNFCLNDNYKVLSQFLIDSFKFNLDFIKYTNDIDEWREVSYNILLSKLNLKYFDEIKNEYTILTNRNNKLILENSTIKDENENIENQIEIIYDNNNNGYLININQNEVYVTIDSLFSLFYYFRGSFPSEDILLDSIEKINLKMKDGNKAFKYEIHFNNSLFLLNTSIHAKENLYLDMDRFSIIYETKDGNIPYGVYLLEIGKLYANIITNNVVRQLFFTDQGFLSFRIEYSEKEINLGISMGTLKIHLSYKDLVCFLKLYLLGAKKYEMVEKKKEDFLKSLIIVQKEMNIKNKNRNIIEYLFKNNDILALSGNFIFIKLDITLIDNSTGSYHPFMNIIFDNISLNRKVDKSIQFIFYFSLYSYNYIACIWEPTIEKNIIQLVNQYETGPQKKIINRTTIDMEKILINLSDMAISYTLLSFNNWLTKFEEEKKNYEDEVIYTNTIENISKVTNNQIINYTGIELKIIHNNKEINCPPFEIIELDYINEENQSNKNKYIELIYDKLKFEIPLEKLITLRHTINNDLSIISENTLSEKRSIIISLYSPIIIINKTIYPLQIRVTNNKIGNNNYELKQNSIFGMPLNYINHNTCFSCYLINKDSLNHKNDVVSKNFTVGKMLDMKTDAYYKIPFKDKILMMKLDHKIRNVRTLTIFSEYSIVNCLPCDISMIVSNKKILIKKCTQSFIDFIVETELIVILSIKTECGEFTSGQINITDLMSKDNSENNAIKFKNKENKKYFSLLYKTKKIGEENIFIIYAEYIFNNDSKFELSIFSNELAKKILCFQVNKNVFIISSKIDLKEDNLTIACGEYTSNKILITNLIESSPYLTVKLKNGDNNILNFNIKNRFSYIQIINNPNLKINISSMIFDILDNCRIINLLSTKKFLICNINSSKKYVSEYAPLSKRGFQFFGKGPDIVLGLSILNLNDKDYKSLIKFKFEIGIFTLTVEDYTFNLEIRKNSSTGCLDVFVIESTIDNSQIILENLSDEGISIYQQNFENNIQILFNKQVQILKIYDFYLPKFIIQTGNSAKVETFVMEKKEKITQLNDKIVLLIEANGIKMKATFYNIKDYNKLKSSLVYYNFSVYIKKIYLSIIKDNEYPDSKLTNYKRNELLLFYISKFYLDSKIESAKGALKKDFIKLSIDLTDLQIYNQESVRGKFSCIFKNRESPFITLYNEINYYNELRIAKIQSQDIKVSKMQLGIDPAFINEVFKFLDNILYRMNITNYNIHKIFLPKNEGYDPNDTINEYNKASILINATELLYPELSINFELSDIGADEFLKETMGCSEFYIWVIKGLIGKKNKLDLDEEYLTYKNGGFLQYLNWFYDNYKQKIDSKITSIGFRGIFGHFQKLLSFDDDKITKVQDNRVRVPRVFYGKFKYMKEFDETEELLIRNTYIRNKNFLRDQYYPIRIIIGTNEFFLFTTIALFKISKSNYALKWDINYFSIKNAEIVDNKVKVNYNQIIDSKEFDIIKCENNSIAKSVSKCINEEIINNKEYLMDI